MCGKKYKIAYYFVCFEKFDAVFWIIRRVKISVHIRIPIKLVKIANFRQRGSWLHVFPFYLFRVWSVVIGQVV